jgi:hypothetical protein
MTIVTTRPRKRPAKPAQAATIKVPRIVKHTPRGRAWKLPPDDPEAKAQAVAFLARMIRPSRPKPHPPQAGHQCGGVLR